MLEIRQEEKGPNILVMGVGGGGNNAINRMISAELKGVNFAAVNTDIAVLNNSLAEQKLQIGAKLLNGYGAGANPERGEAAAMENEEDIINLIADRDMVIITCGMGGGTGTGAVPFIAKCCKQAGILTFAVVTIPFLFENKPRMVAAQGGINKLRENVDTLLVIPNEKLLSISEKSLTLCDAFELADSVLKDTIRGISNIVYNCGKQAVNCPLLETDIAGAENILINTSGQICLKDLDDALNYIRELAGEEVNIIWGTVSEEESDKIVVSLFATGMPEKESTWIIRTVTISHLKEMIRKLYRYRLF